MEFNLTADVIFDEDNDRYTLTTPIFPSGAVTIDCDITRNLNFTFYHEIELGTTQAEGIGRLEVEYGGSTNEAYRQKVREYARTALRAASALRSGRRCLQAAPVSKAH